MCPSAISSAIVIKAQLNRKNAGYLQDTIVKVLTDASSGKFGTCEREWLAPYTGVFPPTSI